MVGKWYFYADSKWTLGAVPAHFSWVIDSTHSADDNPKNAIQDLGNDKVMWYDHFGMPLEMTYELAKSDLDFEA